MGYKCKEVEGKKTPKVPASMGSRTGPTKYHCYASCNKCGDVNDYAMTDSLDGRMMECETKCMKCGFTDYWTHGFFESAQEIESKCQTFSWS